MIFVDGLQFLHNPSGAGGDEYDLLFSLLRHPYLLSASDRFKSSPVWKGSGGRHVYVFQREYATVDPTLVQFVGTDEATTCVGIAIRNRDNGMTSVAHLDSVNVVDYGLVQMLSLVIDKEKDAPLDVNLSFYLRSILIVISIVDQRQLFTDVEINLQVYLVGGFDDAPSEDYPDGSDSSRRRKNPLGYSLPLCARIIKAMRDLTVKFHLCTLCALGHNTREDSKGEKFPIFNGLVVETSSGTVMPAEFNKDSRCPDELVRRIRISVSHEDRNWRGKLLETYDTKNDIFQIAACSWSSYWGVQASLILQLSDSELLLTCSTSPSAESPDFVENERRKFGYLTNYPDWRQTFKKKRPRVFERTADGGWSNCEA